MPNDPLPNPETMTSAERIAAVSTLRKLVLDGGDPSEEQLRWGIDLIRVERADASKQRRKESTQASKVNKGGSITPGKPISAEDL